MAELELYLIRHGLAGEHGSYANDDERPLTAEGQNKTRQVAKKLWALGLRFDHILTSPLARAQQTAVILQEAGLGRSLELSPYLAPGGNLEAWLPWFETWRQGQQKRTLALVGHEPDMSTWAERLVWGHATGKLIFKKAGVMGLLVPGGHQLLANCQLFWLVPPRLLI